MNTGAAGGAATVVEIDGTAVVDGAIDVISAAGTGVPTVLDSAGVSTGPTRGAVTADRDTAGTEAGDDSSLEHEPTTMATTPSHAPRRTHSSSQAHRSLAPVLVARQTRRTVGPSAPNSECVTSASGVCLLTPHASAGCGCCRNGGGRQSLERGNGGGTGHGEPGLSPSFEDYAVGRIMWHRGSAVVTGLVVGIRWLVRSR